MTKRLRFDISRVAAALAAVCCLTANAGIRVYADKFVIAPGETKELTLNMECDSVDYRGFQLDIALPDGLTVVPADSVTALFVTDTARVGSSHKIAFGELGPNRYRMVGYSPTNAKLGGTIGAFLHFWVKAADRAFDDEAINVSAIGFANTANVTEHAGDATMAAVYANRLERVLASGTDGHEYAVADTLVVGGYTGKGYAFVTDGCGSWLKVDLTDGGLKPFVELRTIAPNTLMGRMTDGGVNPTLTLTAEPAAADTVKEVELRTLHLGDLDDGQKFDAAPNEVLKVAGYYVEGADGNWLCQYEQTSLRKGVSLAVAKDWCNNNGDLVDGSSYTLPVVAQIRNAWVSDSDTIANADNYYENYVIYPLEVPVVTTTETVNAAAVQVIGQRGAIVVRGADDADVVVIDAAGRKVAKGHGREFAVSQGVYVVLVYGKAHKVVVK